jgi:hypothetical protein
MSFGEMRKVVSNGHATPGSSNPPLSRRRPAPRRIERSGDFAGYAVSGCRHPTLAIWHVKLWAKNNDEPGRSYTVAAGEFYPVSVLPAEKFAVLRLIALWEADGWG